MRKAIVGLLLLAACKSKPGAGDQPAEGTLSDKERAEVVAKIDDVNITVGEFLDRINKQSPYIRARYTSLERKKEFLQNLIRFEVLAKEAQKRGYDKDAEVVRTMKQVMIQKLMQDEFNNRVKLADITDDEMQKFYNEHIDEYRKPEQVRISQIVVKDAKTAQKVLTDAKTKGQDAKGFHDLVMQYSVDEESKGRGGDVTYFGKDDPKIHKAVIEASFAIDKIGDVAGPVKTDQGFAVVKLTGRRKELNRTFDEVKKQIQNRLYREKRTQSMEDFVKQLKDKAKIVVDDGKLDAVKVDTTTPTAPGGAVGFGAEPMGDDDEPRPAGAPARINPPMPGAPPGMPAPGGPVLAPRPMAPAAPAPQHK